MLRSRLLRFGAFAAPVLLSGCIGAIEGPRSTTRNATTAATIPATRASAVPLDEPPPAELPTAPATASAEQMTHVGSIRPAYAKLETLPIDLATVIRVINAGSPTIGIAQAKLREASARLAKAEVQWLPNISISGVYNRFDGQTQNQRGEVFDVSRANLFGGAGLTLGLDFAEAIYRPIIERRATAAARHSCDAANIFAEYEAVSAYLDLVLAYGRLQVNADILRVGENTLQAVRNAPKSNPDRTAGDVARVATEVLLRHAEKADLEAAVGAASARLTRLLLLPPNVRLIPVESRILPLTLIDPNSSLDDLMATAIENRPDLAAAREAMAAAWARVRKQQHEPLLPKLIVTDQVGSFGGGLNDTLTNFDARNALGIQLTWELRNLGFGNRADTAERIAQRDQASFALVETQARIAAELLEAAQTAAAKYESLAAAEQAVQEASELDRISKEGTINRVDAKTLSDALRPLQAIQALNQARLAYLSAVVEFNRAQFRLYAVLGNRPACAAAAQAAP